MGLRSFLWYNSMMKILLSNAKELNTLLEPSHAQALGPVSKQIVERLSHFSVEELASFYKINLSKVELEKQRWKNIQTGQAKTYPAWLLYDGLMYRYMERTDLTTFQENYLASHVRIATGLYGLISPLTLISPHRLDFQGPLKIDGKSLKQVWRYQYDSEVAEDSHILSLASSEFEQVFSPEVQNKLVRVLFMEEKDGKVKTHSTISKKGRGRMLSWLVKHQVKDIQQIQNFERDGYRYIAEKSSENSLVFIRKS